MEVIMVVNKYDELIPRDRQKIIEQASEKYKPSILPLFGRALLAFFAPAAVAGLLFTGFLSQKLCLKNRMVALLSVSTGAIASMVQGLSKYRRQDKEARIQALYETVKESIPENTFDLVELDKVVYRIDQSGYSRQN
jgi:hypothetical protein